MNVTIKISDQLCREARHRAVDAGCSLSGWIADVIRRELSRAASNTPRTLLEALGNDALSADALHLPRDKTPPPSLADLLDPILDDASTETSDLPPDLSSNKEYMKGYGK